MPEDQITKLGHVTIFGSAISSAPVRSATSVDLTEIICASIEVATT